MSIEPQAHAAMIAPALSEAASFAERTLEALLPQPAGPQAALVEAMRAAVLGRERGYRCFFVLQSGRLFGVDRQPLGRVAAATECAIAAARLAGPGLSPLENLAGQALIAEAFALLASAEAIPDPYVRAELMARLAACTGHGGALGGVAADLTGRAQAEALSLPAISRRQRMKTASMIGFCAEAGPVLAKASPPARHALSAYGQDVGLVLQIAADIADPQSQQDHATMVAAMGAERAKAQCEALAAQAARHLDLFDEKADLLRAAAEFAMTGRASRPLEE